MRGLGCAPKSAGTRNSSIYFSRRLATAGLQLITVTNTCARIIRRCTSEELFFSCCDSVAAPWQRPGHHDQVPAKNNERRRGHRLRHHDQVPATYSGRRCGQRPGHHDQLYRNPKSGRGQQLAKAHIKKARYEYFSTPLCCSGYCSKLRAPHRGTSLDSCVCAGPELTR